MSRAGTTFLELLVVLGLLAFLLGMAAPVAARWRDGVAVRAARDDVASALAWTRIAAVSGQGATLVLHSDSGLLRVHTATGAIGPSSDLGRAYGVRIQPAEATIEIHYDQLGIGRLANRTITFRRGVARAGITISAYGRVRAW